MGQAVGERRYMMPLPLETNTVCVPAREPSQEALTFLNYLRFVSMRCRVKRQTSLFEACALLHVNRNAETEAYAEALMRCIGEALGKPAKLYSVGTIELTFDENWLVQLGIASARQDEASLQFLLKSRVGHEHRRLIRHLVARISDRFFGNDN